MTYKITTDCISCGACEAECPENAISEGDGHLRHRRRRMPGLRLLR